ncbi:MAG: hypothetical protein LBH59_00620, partial [Planctomycetaceae bacterium]|jgi:hypothetical protein|nr:hypothetical protein [Planctomycetaceae bacterium]
MLNYGSNIKLDKPSVEWCNSIDITEYESCPYFDFDSPILLCEIDRQSDCEFVLSDLSNLATPEPASFVIFIIVFFVSIIVLRFLRTR